MPPSLIVLRGVPGSGKSHFAHKLAAAFAATYLSTDAIRAELSGSEGDQSRNREVFPLLDARVAAALRAGDSVVVDATNTDPGRMRFWSQLAAATGAELTVLRIDVPLQVALARNAARERVVPEQAIIEMARQLDESWD